MTEDKKLNDEQIKNVTGGAIYGQSIVPGPDDNLRSDVENLIAERDTVSLPGTSLKPTLGKTTLRPPLQTKIQD